MRALLVEDNRRLVASLTAGLAEEGLTVTSTASGAEAIAIAGRHAADVIVLDLGLPDIDGQDVILRIRAAGSHVPILVLTARETVESRTAALDAGADDYLIKPFAFAELSARLRAMIRREASAPRPVLELGRLALDTTTLTIGVDGKRVPLSVKEFALLRFLLSEPGVAHDRTRILDEVWGTSKHIDPNVVDQYIGYLRRKLDPLSPGMRIATVRGVGYRAEALP